MPTEDGARLRPPYAALGIAGVVVATVFAAVAAVAGKPETQAAPAAEDRPESSVSVTTKSSAVVVVPPPASNNAVVTSTSQKPTTTTPKTTTVTTTTPQQAPPPPSSGPAPRQKPIPRFTADNCPELRCKFDGAASFDPDGSIIYYAWSFGDGEGVDGSRQSGPSHPYARPGTYSVTLLAMDNEGQTSSVTKTVNVG